MHSTRHVTPLNFDPQHNCHHRRKAFEVRRLAKPSYFINCALANLKCVGRYGKNFLRRNPWLLRRPRNIKDVIVRSKFKRVNNDNKRMRKCGKSRCQICKYVKEGCEFNEGSRKFYIISAFDCDTNFNNYRGSTYSRSRYNLIWDTTI